MIPVNYHQLYYFWTIAKAGSYRAATAPLLLAVSTLSLQISQLEKTLGMRLFERDRRGVTLTPEGRVVYEHCERIFIEGEALLSAVKKGPGAAPPSLRVGVQESISAWLILKLIDFVSRLEPGVQVSVFGGGQNELQERLRKHSLDVVVANFDYSVGLGRSFDSRMVGKIPISFVGTPKMKRRIKRFPQDVASVPLLVRTTENPIRRSVDTYLRDQGIRPKIEIEIENPLLIRLLALQGRGVAVLDTLTVHDDLKSGRLVKLHGKAANMEEFVWLLYNTRPKAHPELGRVMRGLAAEFKITL